MAIMAKIMKNYLIFVVLCTILIVGTGGIMIKKECPIDEVHKSCTFFEEYICWLTENRLERIKSQPKRLPHCRSGCFCKKGYVREYHGGECIIAAGCRNQQIRVMLKNLPVNIGLNN